MSVNKENANPDTSDTSPDQYILASMPACMLVKTLPPIYIAQNAYRRLSPKPLYRFQKLRVVDLPKKTRKATELKPEPISSILSDLFKEGRFKQYVNMSLISQKWTEIVGEQVSRNTQIVEYKNGKLTLLASSYNWATILKTMTLKIMNNLRDAGIEDVLEIKINVPKGPSFHRGFRHIKGRGPRDTWI